MQPVIRKKNETVRKLMKEIEREREEGIVLLLTHRLGRGRNDAL